MTDFNYYDEELFDIAYKIERFGYTTIGVNTGTCSVPGCDCSTQSGPGWFYTIGMLEHGHPEIVIVGASADLSCELMSLAFEGHHVGESLPLGRDDLTVLGGATITTIPIPRRCWAESSLVALWHSYYRPVGWPATDSVHDPFVQLVVADADGRFPWDDGCDAAFVTAQPIIADHETVWPRENRATRRANERSNHRRRRKR
jgi:hypothetical protein